MINNETTDENMQDTTLENQQPPADDVGSLYVQGHIKIHDPKTGEVFVDKRNAIHYENISEAIAYSLANKGQSYIYEMHFGNGGTNVDPTGVINYLPSNTTTQNANLYSPTFFKIVDNTATANPNPINNKIEVRHIPGQIYTDLVITCLLDYGEPATQAAFDNSVNLDSEFVFDELGLKARSTDGSESSFNYVTGNYTASTGKLLTHVVFHPVQKALNRLIQIDYTVRIQTLTNLSSIG